MFIVKANYLILFRGKNGIYCQKHVKPINTQHGKTKSFITSQNMTHALTTVLYKIKSNSSHNGVELSLQFIHLLEVRRKELTFLSRALDFRKGIALLFPKDHPLVLLIRTACN